MICHRSFSDQLQYMTEQSPDKFTVDFCLKNFYVYNIRIIHNLIQLHEYIHMYLMSCLVF